LPKTLKFTLPSGATVETTTEKEISVGRKSRPSDPAVTLDLQEHGGFQHGVSRYHAMIVSVKGVLYLRDLNSVNGTLLNNFKLTPITSYALKSGDIITFGSLEVTVEFA
jgi:pSer/pThr/pTyr-binding forkhead associated (FHA) protein